MIRIDSKYLNDIKLNGNSINRIYLDGDVYWGNAHVHIPPPTHLIYGTTSLTGSGTFGIGINNSNYAESKNVSVNYDNGTFWLDELPSSITSITTLAGIFYDVNHIISIDQFNLDTSLVTSWRAAFLCPVSSLGSFSLDLTSTTSLHDAFAATSCESLDLSSWHVTSLCTDIDGMFFSSSNLKHVDVSNWQLNSNLSVGSIFYNTSGIVDMTMNNVSNGTFNNFSRALQNSNPNAKIYRDGDTWVYNGSQWVKQNS